VRNLPTLNNDVVGGHMPGITIRNNTIDQAGFASVKVAGEMRPYVIDSGVYSSVSTILFGDLIVDGTTMTIEAGDTVVVFEFDDIGGSAPSAGSGRGGGNNVQVGRVPIYYRRTSTIGYNGRVPAHNRHEVMLAIYEAIQGSILVTNGLDPLVKATLAQSLRGVNEGGTIGVTSTNVSVYVEGANSIRFSPTVHPFDSYLAPVYEPPQPISRIVNNTFYGEDGLAARFTESGARESNDLLSQAIETRLGTSHTGAYTTVAQIGGTTGVLAAGADVDFFKVHLDAGDRLVVDIDTLANGPDTAIRLFDVNGVELVLNRQGQARADLDIGLVDTAAGQTVDPFVDFTARLEGTYYVGISSDGNNSYDSNSLSGRLVGTGGTGAYQLGMQVYAPRSFVLSIANPNVVPLGGTTFTITQVADLANAATNRQVITIPGQGGEDFPADAIQDISDAINAAPLLNHTLGNGPDGLSGPVRRVISAALGGPDGVTGPNSGLRLFPTFPVDANTPFGHDRIFGGTPGTTELYVFIERAAEIELSEGAISAGLRLDPFVGFNTDQLLPETGVLLTGGSSGTILNNVFSNLHQGLVLEDPLGDFHPKHAGFDNIAVVTGNVFQHISNSVPVFRTRPDTIAPGITPGPSNVNGGADDFNVTLPPTAPLFAFASGGNFLPASNSFIIDSSVNSLVERASVADLRRSVGLAVSNVLAPNRDVNGVLRADNPNVAPPGGLGSQTFKDRGSNELADFVGPVAIADFARDNDPEGVDADQATSFLRLQSGIYNEFRIQLRDTGDSSDPFAGLGIDDNTVVVASLEDLRSPGANITLFEGDRLLAEGIDYTFSFDTSKNIVTLRPIAGLWRNDLAYRILLNNRDRTVGTAPSAGQVFDGDSFTITDANGGRVNYEYDSGYQLIVPEALQFTIPVSGGRAGGIADGDTFSITDAQGTPIRFEFNLDAFQLPNTRPVPFTINDTPEVIAESARLAIANAVQAGVLDVDVIRDGSTVVIGSNAGTLLDTSASGLLLAPRTAALNIPASGAGIGGVTDGVTLTLSDGNTTVTFEFDTNGVIAGAGNTAIPITGLTAAGISAAIVTAIENTTLRLTPFDIDGRLFLALPSTGSVVVSPGQLVAVGVSRTPNDGETITFDPLFGANVTFELTTDTAQTAGNIPIEFTRADTADQLASKIATAIQTVPIGDRDPQGNIILGGLNSQLVQATPGGLVSIGGTNGLVLTLSEDSSLSVTGEPDVTESTLLTIDGPLLVQLPTIGGNGITDNSEFTLTNGLLSETFLFNIQNTDTGQNNLNKTPIVYQAFQDAATIATAMVATINASNLGIVATALGGGLISLGQIDPEQLTFAEDTDPDPLVGPIPAPLAIRLGIVADGEQVVITQGNITRTFEFESSESGGGVTAGAIPITFQPSGTVADVTNLLAAAINNNRGGLVIQALVLPGEAGRVRLVDTPQTVTTTVGAPITDATGAVTGNGPATIDVSGQPGGARPVSYNGSFTADAMKRAIIDAINKSNAGNLSVVTATDRGGATFFMENVGIIEGNLINYYLPGIKDLAGNLLEPTREDNTTQFTMLLPTVGLDFGDAPDPLSGVRGRYPTQLDVDGARHLVGDEVRLGRLIDVDSNGLANVGADGDDTTIFILGTTGTVFQPTVASGFVQVAFNLPTAVTAADGQTVTLSTGVNTATFEFDTDGIFNENHFAVRVNATGTVTQASVAEAFVLAVRESNLSPADVRVEGNTALVITDDEDGVVFSSEFNPTGVFNRGFITPISVTVTGGGVLEAWIDFNADGDFTDPGEQIINPLVNEDDKLAIFPNNVTAVPLTRTFPIEIPATTAAVTVPTFTYARFRVSTDGGLAPTGLALSGEVEDYRITILPGLPPNVNASNSELDYTLDEDSILQARDSDGTLTPGSANDNGALAGITDPDGDAVAVFASDVGQRELLSDTGIPAGTLNLFADGSFSFSPVADFVGNTKFTFRVTDVKPGALDTQLVSPNTVTVNLVVRPVNDRPFVSGATPTINVTINEDTTREFSAAQLTGFFTPGPANEAGQPLEIQSAGVAGTGFQTARGGTLALVNGTLIYTPPVNFNGPETDRFTYVVADDPQDLNQLVQSAVTQGTVVITFNPINDPPIAVTDTYTSQQNSPLVIPVNGPGGILNNDLVGPDDERIAGQTVVLVREGVSAQTLRGGTITVSSNGQTVTYNPPAGFDGRDQFTYQITDTGTSPQRSTGTVLINVGGDNDPPEFVGVNGNAAVQSIVLDESKETEETYTYNLSSWFRDPEGNNSRFQVTSLNPEIIRVQSVTFNEATGLTSLVLAAPVAKFGTTGLVVTATNVGIQDGPSTVQTVPVVVNNTPDPISIIGRLGTLTKDEDEVIEESLTGIFSDPDGGTIQYRVTRLGGVDVISAATAFAESPLIRSITFPGNTMRIELDEDASGSVEIEISARDNISEVFERFTLIVRPVNDAPRGVADFYNVPLGARTQIVAPSLVANDVNPDGNATTNSTQSVRVLASSVTQPSKGSVAVNDDGSFTYTNTSGITGETDTFTYQPVGPNGLVGSAVTVTLNLGRSRYQNPIPGFSTDVTANGVITPLDALRIINRLSRDRVASIPVGNLTSTPPDFLDVNGDGFVRANDALLVINEISRRNRIQLGLSEGEGESSPATFASTVAYAAPTNIGLTQSNLVVPLVTDLPPESAPIAYDPFAAGFDVIDGRAENSSEELINLSQSAESTENSVSAVDEVLSSWLDPTNL
jgi:hypothetical protein